MKNEKRGITQKQIKTSTTPSCSGPIPAQKSRGNSVLGVVFSNTMPKKDFRYSHRFSWEKYTKGSSIYQLTPGGGVWAKVSSWCQQGGGSGPSVSWQSRNLMVEAYHACFRPVIPLFRPTNCHFVIRWMIFTKNMIFIAKITRRKKSHWKMSRNVFRVKKIGAKSIFRHYF